MTHSPTHRDSSVRPAAWALIGTILIGTLAGLRWEGRRWWCQAGDWSLGTSGIKSAHTSQHLLDPYSGTHVLHGLLFAAVLWLIARRWRWDVRLVWALALESGWELIENSDRVIDRYRAATIALGYDGDSVLNSLGDIASCGIGLVLARWLPVRWSVLLFGVVEASLLVAYRDNLLLNMIMLLHSFDSIRTWQAGG